MKQTVAILIITAMSAAAIEIPATTPAGGSIIAQVADGGGWQTTFTVANLRLTPTTWQLTCHDQNGNPLPFTWIGVGTAYDLNGDLPGFGTAEYSTQGTGLLTQGWCYLYSPSVVAGSAVFKYLPTGIEVGVQASVQLSPTQVLPFNNTNGYHYGVALANPNLNPWVIPFGQNPCEANPPADVITVTFKDASGNTFDTEGFGIPGCGYTTFTLDQLFPSTAGKMGTATFTLVQGNALVGLGLLASTNNYNVLQSLTSVSLFTPVP